MPEREEVDRGAADDLVGAQVDREEGVDERHSAAGDGSATTRPSDPGARLVGAADAEKRAHQHHPLEADVHDAAALRDHPADRARTRAASRSGASPRRAPTRRRRSRGCRCSSASRGSRRRCRAIPATIAPTPSLRTPRGSRARRGRSRRVRRRSADGAPGASTGGSATQSAPDAEHDPDPRARAARRAAARRRCATAALRRRARGPPVAGSPSAAQPAPRLHR